MTWKNPPSNHSKVVEDTHAKNVRRLGIEAGARLIRKTPRDTGRAANGWIPSVQAPSGVISTRTSGALSSVKATFGAGKVPPFAVLYVTNNVPYIGELNNGTSKQAPAHFVEMTVEELGGLVSVI